MGNSETSSIRRPNKRFTRLWIGVAVVLVTWLVAAYLILPNVIRSAYAGESLEFLNRVISGQDTRSVDVYLDLWASIAHRLSLVFAGLAIFGYATMIFGGRVAAAVGPRLSVWIATDAPPVSPRELLAWALAIGVVIGYAEFGAVVLRRTFTEWAGLEYSREAAWMTPGISILLLGTVGLLLLALNRIKLRPITWRVANLVLWGLATYGLLRATFSGLATWAGAILALGLAIRIGTALEDHRARFRPVIARVAMGGVALVVLLAPGMVIARWARERMAWATHPPPEAAGPNVLLLVLDTVRAASLSLYGYERSTSPHLEQWAERGVVFERAVAPAPWTLPSHASMFSGTLHPDAAWESTLKWSTPTLADAFTETGYATAGFMANLNYGPEYFGLQQGFTRYHSYPVNWEMMRQSSHLGRALERTYRGAIGALDRIPVLVRAADINRRFLAWQDGLPEGRPFFAFLNYIDAHEPYLPPEPYTTLFAGPDGRRRLQRGEALDPDQTREMKDAYDGAISYIDAQLHELLTTLEQRGALDNTIVIITSDHGEEFNEHGVMGHSMSLYMPSLHVPLVVLYPPRVPRGTRVAATASLLDIPATVMDLTGAPPLTFPGSSLASQWERPDDAEHRPAYSATIKTHWVPPDSYPISNGDMESLVRNVLHYIRNGDGREEVYDLARDPWEQVDLRDSLETAGALEAFRTGMASITADPGRPPR